MLKLKFQYSGHLMGNADSLEKTLMLGKIEGRRRRGQQRIKRLDSITDSMDVSLSKRWKIVKDRKAGLLQSMGSQRAGHDLATEQQLSTGPTLPAGAETGFTQAQTPRNSVRTCQGLTQHTTWPKSGTTVGQRSFTPWQEWLFQGQACDSFQAQESEAQGIYGIVEREYFFSFGSGRI